MKKQLILALCGLVVVFASTAVAQAAGNPLDQGYSRPAAGGSYVAIVGCFVNGGSVTVPAGVPFTVYGGWSALRIGQVADWLHGSTNTLSVDDGASIAMTPYFAGLTSDWNPGVWTDIFFYEVGALAAGESVNVAWTMDLTHPMLDGVTDFPGKPPFTSGSTTFNCTVTGA